uniref:SCP domain-containing protein n=1 Tax=Romanomermis culicivorax TaxID=13658 RepID=A0A915I3Z4_ROMCU
MVAVLEQWQCWDGGGVGARSCYPIDVYGLQLKNKWNTGLAAHAGTKYAYACRNEGDNENGFRFYDNRNAVDQNTIVSIYQYNQGAGKDWSEQQIVQEFLDRWASAGARHMYGSCVIKNPKDPQLYRDVIRFIQMIWGESSQVGCALKACPAKYTFACTFALGGTKLLDCVNAGRSNIGCGDYRRYGNNAICMQLPYANSSKPQIDAFSS